MAATSFTNSLITFATKHKKAAAAQEPFKRILSTSVEELEIDSDALGTFTGETERQGSMIDALRGKVTLARAKTTCRLVLTSEGSFSSSGGVGFGAAGMVHGIEMLMLHDALTGVEILEQHITYDTNYASAAITTADEFHRFLDQISFGSHAVALYPSGVALQGNVQKGISDRVQADNVFAKLLSQSPNHTVIAVSDMRAHVNPTRMDAIKACCELLAVRLATPCPSCGSGGFGLTATIPGLPCAECGCATTRAKFERHSCPFCGTTKDLPRADGKQSVSAAECEWCNP
jgi:hypothetical protein